MLVFKKVAMLRHRHFFLSWSEVLRCAWKILRQSHEANPIT
jgi:hypothetical protein